jgi:hypothetical protein
MATTTGRSKVRIAPRPTPNRWRGAQLEFQQPLPCVNAQPWDFPTQTLNYISLVRSVERGCKRTLGRGPQVEFQTPLALRAPVAQVTVTGVLDATGTGTGTFVSAAEDAKAFSMTGTGTASFAGGSTAVAVYSATGTGTATFIGVADFNAVLSATGTGTPLFISAATDAKAFSMTGTGTATFVGASQADSAIAATGTGTALLRGASTADATLSATGIANVSFAGATTADAILAATGTWTATFSYASEGSGALAATGTGTALFAADALLDAALSATGTGDASFVGAFDTTGVTPDTGVQDGGGYDVGAEASRLRANAQRKKKRKKKEALNELDQLLLDLRGQIAPWQKAKAYEAEQALYRDTLARGEALDASDTLAKIESEIVNLKELLAEIDEEEAIMLLLM